MFLQILVLLTAFYKHINNSIIAKAYHSIVSYSMVLLYGRNNEGLGLVLLFSGLDYWTGTLDYWTGTLDYWTGTLDWLAYIWLFHILWLDLWSLACKIAHLGHMQPTQMLKMSSGIYENCISPFIMPLYITYSLTCNVAGTAGYATEIINQRSTCQ